MSQKKKKYFSNRFISKPDEKVTIGFAAEPQNLYEEINALSGITESVKESLSSIADRVIEHFSFWYVDIHNFKSVARLGGDDAWDEEIGKKVVDLRNEIKFRKYRLRQLNGMHRYLVKLEQTVDNMKTAHGDALLEALRKISEYLGEDVEHENN